MPVSTNPFERIDGGAAVYRDVRPSYPLHSVNHVVTLARNVTEKQPQGDPGSCVCNVVPECLILDVGAGTGKFTAQLLEAGCDVWALEPSAQMRSEFLATVPHFNPEHLLDGYAENISAPNAVFNAVTYAQSWHWLNAESASREAARVLRPNGVIAILANQLAVDVPWVHRLTRIMRSGDVYKPSYMPDFGECFTMPQFVSTTWVQHMSVSSIYELGTTRSSWIRASEQQRAKMRANLEWYLTDHLGYTDESVIDLPYHTYTWWAHKI